MNDGAFVRRFERERDLAGEPEHFVDRQSAAADVIRQRSAGDQLHHDGASVAGSFEAVDLSDVRMVQGRERLRFAFETRQPFRPGCCPG